MTGTISPTIPTLGSPNATEDADIKSSLETIRDGLNAILNSDNTVMGMQNYRNVLSSRLGFSENGSSGTFYLTSNDITGVVSRYKSGVSVGQSLSQVNFFYFDDADYAIPGRTLKMRIRVQIATNATKPTCKFVVGLYPLTVGGGADEFIPTLGVVVPNSTVEFNEPAASTITQKEASDFTVPADGAYILGVVQTGEIPTNALLQINAQLQVRNV